MEGYINFNQTHCIYHTTIISNYYNIIYLYHLSLLITFKAIRDTDVSYEA